MKGKPQSTIKLEKIRKLVVEENLDGKMIRERLGINESQYHKIITRLGLARKFKGAHDDTSHAN
jgi:hypothetical protein